MDLHLTGKIAFVAASSSGLGKSVAIELAKEGAQVIICGRNPDTLNKAKRAIPQNSKRKKSTIHYCYTSRSFSI